jgi:hypothetical protein
VAKGLLLSACLVAVWAAAVRLLLRPRSEAPLNVMVTTWVPVVPVYVLAYRLTPADLGVLPAPLAATPMPLGLLNGVLALAVLSLTVVQVYYHFHNSITLRLLTEFARAPHHALTPAQIEAVCGVQVLLDERLRALERARLLRRRGDRLYPTAAGSLAAGIARVWRAVLRVSP